MTQTVQLSLSPDEASRPDVIRQALSDSLAISPSRLGGYILQKRSLDARGSRIQIRLSLLAYIDETPPTGGPAPVSFPSAHQSPRTVGIIGCGPAGLFAALYLLENGIRPILIDRGKDVKRRRRDLAALNKSGELNPDSNYCFGEGGAGTYSDGKLYTRSTKRGNMNRILQLFIQFGASPDIAVDAHPHIGTNKLPKIIEAMRQQILDAGGEVHFETRMTDLEIHQGEVKAILTQRGDRLAVDACILATGHSARDVFEWFHRRALQLEPKPFALGFRVEHPQALIDSIQYRCPSRPDTLPPASYSLVAQTGERSVFSFCMCPGGIIAPASTSPGELVVNGWSPSKRNNPFANSGMVAQVLPQDLNFLPTHPGREVLAYLDFQQNVEARAFEAGGGRFVAPAQRLTDFCEGKISPTLPDCSYVPGVQSADLHQLLPPRMAQALASGLRQFGKKLKGYHTREAILLATESRTSSPVRIPRDSATLTHPQLSNLYPCGEGAGYAGGIMSAAMDGERCAAAIVERWSGH